MPEIAFAPASGSMSSGTTWVFVPTWATPEANIRVESKLAVEVHTSEVSRNDSFVTYRVRVVPTGRHIGRTDYTVIADDARASYHVPHQEFLRASGAVALEDARYEEDRWTCSYTDAVIATPSIAASAYRLDWAASAEDYRAGRVESLVVPWNLSAFFGRTDVSPEILLGHKSCFGATLDEADVARGVFIGVTALVTGDEARPADPIEVRAKPLVVRQLEPEVPKAKPVTKPDTTSGDARDSLVCPGPPVEYDDSYYVDPPFSGRCAAIIGILVGLFIGLLGFRRMSETTRAQLDAWSLPQIALLITASGAAMTQSAAVAGCIAPSVIGFAFALASLLSVLAAFVQFGR